MAPKGALHRYAGESFLWEGACSRRKRPLNGAFLRFWRAERRVSSETRHEWGMDERDAVTQAEAELLTPRYRANA